MKKNLPNIILLILLAGLIGLLVWLYKGFGLGVFLKAFGIFILSAGILAFLFFLSIDPGYGWSRTVNFNANYITIAIAVVVTLVGLLLFLVGRTVQKTIVREQLEATRCRTMLDANVGDVVDSEWYFLSDRKDDEELALYLFQKKGEVKNFKLIVIDSSNDQKRRIKRISVSSPLAENQTVVGARRGECAGIFEADLVTRKPEAYEGSTETRFDVKIDYVRDEARGQKEGRIFQMEYQLENIYCF